MTLRAYKGDAMTLLCFDIDEKMKENFSGFSIKVTPPATGKNKKPKPYYLINRLTYKPGIYEERGIKLQQKDLETMEFAPLQKFNWVHVPGTNHNINAYLFGDYKYEVTPRYLINNVLQPIKQSLTVSVTIDVSPYKSGVLQVGFARGFIESQAYTRHFGMNSKIRPDKTNLLFNLSAISGPTAKDKKKWPLLKDYDFETQHKWLGWQARGRITELLDETLKNKSLSLDVFAFDLDEPYICESLLQLAKEDRLRIILDNSSTHNRATDFETKFEKLFRKTAKDTGALVRGKFLALSHSKVFIQKKGAVAQKVLTGSTNFSTNGLYVNANHVLIFTHKGIAKLYENIFTESFGKNNTDTVKKMKAFKESESQATVFSFKKISGVKQMSIYFSPHNSTTATKIFADISKRISKARTDVLFAIMNDRSKSSILDAVYKQVQNTKIFTYGITDIGGKSEKRSIMLYKPHTSKGVRIAGKPGDYVLMPPFEEEAKIPGISIHHKFVVSDFKGPDPVVYCGSSNLAFGPEQSNGDNLLEIRDPDAVTVFAVEALRLVDHFHWRNVQAQAQKNKMKTKTKAGKQNAGKLFLHDSSEAKWVEKYFDKKDLRCKQRELLIGSRKLN